MIILTSTLGLEGAVALEVKSYGYRIAYSESGKVFVNAKYSDIPFMNIYMRSAERVLFVVGRFHARSFDDLYDGIRSLDWSFIPNGSRVWIAKVKSVSSKLFAERSIQSVAMKAVADSLKLGSGPRYPVFINIKNDEVTVSADSTGEKGLHVRGYRKKYSRAPLRETIAASLLILARYKGENFIDPFCGSGTIPIEAALMAKNIAPGIKRSFASENWADLKDIYRKLKERTKSETKDIDPPIICSDIDEDILKVASENAGRAGVKIEIMRRDFRDIRCEGEGKIVTNPPYGERMKGVWRDFKTIFKSCPKWEKHFISPIKNISKIVRKSPDKSIPFFNSGLKVFFHQYYRIKKGQDNSPHP